MAGAWPAHGRRMAGAWLALTTGLETGPGAWPAHGRRMAAHGWR
jgi:hypothetical protein